jgi:GAF domain-containing protein
MDRHPIDLDLLLGDPFVRVSHTGETLEHNRAFLELAEHCGASPELRQVFGPAVVPLLEQAAREGRTCAFLPLARGPEPRRTYRIALTSGGPRASIAALLVDVSDEIAWRRQLFERNRDLTVLNDIGAAVSSTLDLDALARRIYEQAGRIMRTHNFYIALHDRETDTIVFPIYIEDQAPRKLSQRPFANGLTEHVLRTQRPLLLSGDVLAQARALGADPIGRPSCAYLAVPMLSDGEAVGVIALQDFESAEAYTQHDLEVLTIVAGQGAAAVRNARLFADTRTAYLELSQAQQRLLESERLRGITETVGALNHEVNNPLAAIAGNAQLLLRGAYRLSDEVRQKVESMLEGARRIQRVTGKMATLIQATSSPYPGQGVILDVERSVSRDELADPPVGPDPAAAEALGGPIAPARPRPAEAPAPAAAPDPGDPPTS